MAFFEFNIAVSGLFAAQRGLSVTSNNITNATTPGYSRQSLGQKASIPLAGIGAGMLGTGVATTNVTRVRDSYLDTKLWSQNDRLGEYKIKVEQNSIIETVYGEPSETGFSKVLTDLFTSIDTLGNIPNAPERKTGMRQYMINFTKYFNNVSASLSGFQNDLNFELKSKVDEINLLGSKIQSLNDQIYKAEMFGDNANTFRDERDLCVDRLSQLINVEAREEEITRDGITSKQFTVKVAGQKLVEHLSLRELTITVRGTDEEQINAYAAGMEQKLKRLKDTTTLPPLSGPEITQLRTEIQASFDKIKAINPSAVQNFNVMDTAVPVADLSTYIMTIDGKQVVADLEQKIKLSPKKLNEEDVSGLYDVVWRDGMPFDMSDKNMSGELKGVIDMRDGCGTGSDVTYNGIPYYIKRMDEYVRKFAAAMNEVYSKDKDGYAELTKLVEPVNPADPLATETIFKKRDANGNVQYYNASDKNTPLNLTVADKEKLANKCQPKYQLFSYTNGGNTGTPADPSDLANGYKQMTSSNFSISKDIFDNSNNIRTNYEHYTEGDVDINPNVSAKDLLLELFNQKDNRNMFKEGNPKDYMISVFSELGINAQEAQMYESSQTSITNNITNQRLAVSQVDPNEEFVSLIKYQQAYQAAAKIINTIDGIYETTIFKLGNF